MTSDSNKAVLSDVASINPRRRIHKGVSAPFIEMAALPTNGRDIPQSSMKTRIAKGSGAHFTNGDTLLARITPCLENGKTAQVSGLPAGVIGEGSTEFIVLCGTNPKDNDYVYYVCRSPEFRNFAISRMQGTSGRQRVAWRLIADYPLILPAPGVRREAAAILATLDDRIRNLRETNRTLERIAQTLFKSWFVDFDPVHAKAEGREPEGVDPATAALFPREFEDSDLGPIPKDWRVAQIGNLVTCVGGATPSTKNESFWNDGIHHWATPKDLSTLQSPVLLDTARKVTDAGLAKISSGLLPAGTLLLSSRAPIGYQAITVHPTAINQGFIAMSPGGDLSPLFLYCWCKENMDLIKKNANGSTFMEISKKAFRPIPVCAPPAAPRATFDRQVGPIFEKIKTNEEQRQTLVELRDTLLPRLISGKLYLHDALETADALA